ncbi:unnamed protein product [Scytosiphon promiscuus]
MMFKVYHSATAPNPYGGLPTRSEEIISIFHDARTLQKKVLTAIPDSVISVDLEKGSPSSPASSVLQEALAEGGAGDEGFAAVLFTEAGKASPVLRALASQVNGRVTSVQARMPKRSDADEDEEEEEAKGNGGEGKLAGLLKGVIDIQGTLPSVPCLVLVDKSSGTGSVYGGAVDNAQEMLAFILDGAGITLEALSADNESTGEDDRQDDGSGKKSTKKGGVSDSDGLLRLDPALLETLEEKGAEALVVAFVEGGDVGSVPGWGDATKGLQGQIRAAVMDCSAHPSQCEGSPKNKAPHLKVYPHARGVDGNKRAFPSEFPASKVKEAVAEAEASLPELITVIPAGVNGQMIQEAVQNFLSVNLFAEENPMCLFVLSRKDEPNLVVKTVSAAFQSSNIRTMFVSNPDDMLLASFGIYKLPALVLMFPEKEGMESSGMDPNQRKPAPGEKAMITAHYHPGQWGPVTHNHVSDFILQHLGAVDTDAFQVYMHEVAVTAKLNGEKVPKRYERVLGEMGELDESESSPSGGGAGRSPTTFHGVPELTPALWASINGDDGHHPRTSVGVFLLDRFSEGFASALEAAEKAAEQATARLGKLAGGIGFAWVDAPCQEGFAKDLGLYDVSEVPVLVAFSPKHQKSARFVGAWEADSLGTFLGRALGGRAPLFPIGDTPPRLEEGVDCSKRPAPAWLSGDDGDGSGDAGDDEDMEDFMAEILAEEAKAKRELEEEVARGLQEMKDAEESAAAPPKRTTKTVKKKKKKKSKSSARSEL